MSMKEVKIKYKQPKSIKITDDIWFYRSPKFIDFVVWEPKVEGRERICIQFKVSIKKLLK
jgi:hypothetical protein